MITPKIICNYLLKKQGTATPLVVQLVNDKNEPIKNKSLKIFINGKWYNRTTDNNGNASLNINLTAGNYQTTITVIGDNTYREVSKGVLVSVVSNKVTPTLKVDNLTKIYGTSEPLKAQLSYNGNVLTDKDVTFKINNVTYTRKTDINGIASLNINLPPNTYPVVVSLPVNDTLNIVTKNVNVNVTVDKSVPELTVNDLTKTYGTSTPLIAKLTINGTPLINREVTININGVNYKRTTNNNGDVSLNINLNPGTYPVKVTKPAEQYYQAVTSYATVKVNKAKPTIHANNLEKTYKGKEQFTCKILGYDNKPLTNKSIALTINGVKYNRTTNNNGEASLNINLPPNLYEILITVYGDVHYDAVTVSRTIRVNKQKTRMEGTNITKFAKDTAVYQCAVYNEHNERVQGTINFKVNGVEYQRHTGTDGLAKLNIRLWTGEYRIRAWFSGDNLYKGSSVENDITVKMNAGTKAKIEGESVTSTESKIYVGGHPDASGGIILDTNVIEMMDKIYPDGIPFTDYEITESDQRTKTAKFTTPLGLDLTSNFTYCIITNPYHEDFGGVVLSEEYDADKDLYTYQCQDWRRQYLSKTRLKSAGDTNKYEFIKASLITPFLLETFNSPISKEQEKQYSKYLTGLRPLNEYKIKTGVLKPQNYLEQKAETFLSYDSIIDSIMNIALDGQNNLDIWFDKYGVCHLDPIDWDYWLNTGLLLTTENIAEYKYGFDTTNILTGVKVKNADNSSPRTFLNNYSYPNGANGTKFGDDLAIIFGNHCSMIDGPKTETGTSNTGTSTTTSTGTNNVTSGIMSGKQSFAVGCDGGTSTQRITEVINALKAKGHDAISVGQGPSSVTNYGLRSASKGKIGIFIVNGNDGGVFYDFVQSYYGYKYMIMMFESQKATTDKWITCNAMKNTKCYIDPRQGYASSVYRSGVENYTPEQWMKKYPGKMAVACGPKGCSFQDVINNLVNGNLIDGSGSSSSTTTTNNSGTTTQQNVDVNSPEYIAEQYRLAVAEYSKSVRSLMKFSIKIPLNDPIYKILHTNSFLFTDLPEKFALINLPKIYKNLASYKVSRGVPYVKNRWYIEQVKIKHDSKGLFADVTLNAFPSDLSSFSSAMKGYISAYDSAFKSTSNTTTTNGTTNTSSNNIPARTDGKTDCSSTYSLCCAHTGNSSNPSNKGYENRANAQGKIGKEGTNYAEYVKGCTPKEAYKKLAKKHNYGNYVGYSDNRHTCASNTLNASTSNCGDRARLLKACMDVLGQPCVIYHVYNHYMNGVLINGKWETVDLCYQSGSMPQYQTAGWNR